MSTVAHGIDDLKADLNANEKYYQEVISSNLSSYTLQTKELKEENEQLKNNFDTLKQQV